MSEYIECRSCPSPSCKGCNIYTLATMLRRGAFDCLMNGNRSIIPAADVVEVKHGRWMMTLYTTTSKRRRVISNKKYDCSECGYGNGRKQSPYCPNCGAKMDGE